MNPIFFGLTLFALAGIEMVQPGWRGFFMDPIDMTPGEARISSSVLMVGGLMIFTRS